MKSDPDKGGVTQQTLSADTDLLIKAHLISHNNKQEVICRK